MKRIALSMIALILLAASSTFATASVIAKIDLSQQKMRVYVNGKMSYSWSVSTARRGYRTPTGSYRPKILKRMHYSSKYNNSPMPHSVFFRGGYAIHGTNHLRSLGRPASHGCVRLHPSNARRLYKLIRRHGKGNTRIVIQR